MRALCCANPQTSQGTEQHLKSENTLFIHLFLFVVSQNTLDACKKKKELGLRPPVVFLSLWAVAKQASCSRHGTALLLLWFPYLQDVVQPWPAIFSLLLRVPAYCWCWQRHKSALSCLFAVLSTLKSAPATKHYCKNLLIYSFSSLQHFTGLTQHVLKAKFFFFFSLHVVI